MRPLMILAATVAGLARYMDAWLDPIRPGKFRLVLLMQVFTRRNDSLMGAQACTAARRGYGCSCIH